MSDASFIVVLSAVSPAPPLRCACGAKRKAAGPQCVHVTCYKPRNTLLSKGFAIWALPTDTDNIIFWLSVRGFHCCSFEFSSTQSMSRSIHKKPLLMWADRRLSFLKRLWGVSWFSWFDIFFFFDKVWWKYIYWALEPLWVVIGSCVTSA